ncbi:glycosyltransferase [Gelidibacter sp. F2691]|nr:glycosyltransferase [Gelidibacter sp. F2691]
MKTKILLLPTYWPSMEAPIVGSQINEQAELMLEEFDIRTLYCKPGMGLKRFIILFLFGVFLKDKIYSQIKVHPKSKVNTNGVYYFNSRLFPNKVNSFFKKRAYLYSFSKILNDNWLPDLMHSRGFEYGGEGAYQINRKYNIPYIHTENTAFIFDKTFNLYRLELYKNVLTKATSICTVSNFLLRNTLMHGFLTNQIYFNVGNPVNEKIFYPLNLQNDKNEFRILITGYNAFIKDFPTFFKAIQKLVVSGNTNIKAIIAMTYGNNNSKEELIELAKSMNIERYCEFHIAVSREKMPLLINSCDVCVSTSLIETFGIATLEALFCGIPVVSTRNGGIDEFISSESGILCDIGDYSGISEALAKILNKEIVFSADKIRESVMGKFDTKAFKKRMMLIYNKSVNNAK